MLIVDTKKVWTG